jgi:hypothetical protein
MAMLHGVRAFEKSKSVTWEMRMWLYVGYYVLNDKVRNVSDFRSQVNETVLEVCTSICSIQLSMLVLRTKQKPLIHRTVRSEL